jgi:acyl-CoA synthetase (AMP-forming)/AMP-acid ligase II
MLFHSPWFSLNPYPEISLADLLAPAAEAHRDRPALINVDGTTHTFGHAWQACRRLGRFLQDNGIEKGDRVAILSANAPEYFVAFYGTIFAGGVVTTPEPALQGARGPAPARGQRRQGHLCDGRAVAHRRGGA